MQAPWCKGFEFSFCSFVYITQSWVQHQCSTLKNNLSTTLESQIPSICRVSLLKRREQLGFPTCALLCCALPLTAEWDQPAGRSHRHQTFQVSLWQVAQLLVKGIFSYSNRNGDNSVCSAQNLITEPRVLLPIPSMLFYISLALF